MKPFIYIDSFNPESFVFFNTKESASYAFPPESTSYPDSLKTQPVDVLIASTQIYLTEVNLPNTSIAQLQKAIPFAIEDELAEPIEDLHFALGPKVKEQPIAVAVINKQLLQQLLDKFREAGLNVQSMFFAPLLLPYNTNQWSIAILDEQLMWVKTAPNNGFITPLKQASTLLNLQVKSAPNLPEAIKIYNTSSKFELLFENPGLKIEEENISQDKLLEIISNQLEHSSTTLNLLQGEFRVTQSLDKTKKSWLIAGGCFAIWLLLSVVGKMGYYVYLSHQNTILKQKIDAVYKEAFPGATAIVSPKIRLQRALANYQHSNYDDGFLSILSSVGPILKSNPQVKVLSAEFQNQIVNLKIETNSFASLQKFASALNHTNVFSQQLNARTEDKNVLANFNISLTKEAS